MDVTLNPRPVAEGDIVKHSIQKYTGKVIKTNPNGQCLVEVQGSLKELYPFGIVAMAKDLIPTNE